VKPWNSPLASRYDPAITPESLMEPAKVLNGGAFGSLTVVNVPRGPAKATLLPLLSV
jgi:hypothetical protein